MSNNAQQPAFPEIDTERKSNMNDWGRVYTKGGLTKREWFAGMAMQGLMACEYKGVGLQWEETLEQAAKISAQAADALLAELEKQQP